MNSDGAEKMINALGTMAEMALVFYRSAASAGATREEATAITQAYLGAMIFGRGKDAGTSGNEDD